MLGFRLLDSDLSFKAGPIALLSSPVQGNRTLSYLPVFGGGIMEVPDTPSAGTGLEEGSLVA